MLRRLVPIKPIYRMSIYDWAKDPEYMIQPEEKKEKKEQVKEERKSNKVYTMKALFEGNTSPLSFEADTLTKVVDKVNAYAHKHNRKIVRMYLYKVTTES